MSRPGIIAAEEPDVCELCGKFAELRPYGPNGERICWDCGHKDPETTKVTQQKLGEYLYGDKKPN